MRASGFTFLRNAQKLGYPFIASIRSILPIVDEFVVALGPSDDDTEQLLFVVLDGHKKGRYPRAARVEATIYHYGWIRSEREMNLKANAVSRYWSKESAPTIQYAQIDPKSLRLFSGTHPRCIQGYLPEAEGIFRPDPTHRLTVRERRHRVMLLLEKWCGVRFGKRHYVNVALGVESARTS